MKEILFIIQNPFQTLTAMIMRKQQFQDCICDALITDRSSDMNVRADRLREIGLFRSVFFVHTMQCWNKGSGFTHHMGQVKCCICGCSQKELEEIPLDYDVIITLLYTCVVGELVNRMHRVGKDPEIDLVDEGFGCYTDIYREALFGFHNGRDCFEKIGRYFRKGEDPKKLTKAFYLYRPDLLMWDAPYELRVIDKPDFEANPKLKDDINYVFSYNEEARIFENKVTIFEGGEFQDYGDNRDLQIIVDIAEMVGYENVIVKLHPRTQVNRFKQRGITTTDELNVRQGIPWEVIAMNMAEESNCLFVSASSGAVITYSLLFEKSYHVILFAKCLEGEELKTDKKKLWFLEKYAEENPEIFALPENTQQLRLLLTKWYGK